MSNLLDNIYVEYPVTRLTQLLDSAIDNAQYHLNKLELIRHKNINSIESEYNKRTWFGKLCIKEFTKIKSSLKESEVVKLNVTTLDLIKSWSDG